MFFGEILRKERERQGLTIEDVAQETKIQKRYLRDIENGNIKDIPGGVYVKGFLKNYAEYLKMEKSAIMENYQEYLELKEKKEAIVEDIGTKKDKSKVKLLKKLKIGIITILILIVIVFLGKVFYTNILYDDIEKNQNITKQENQSVSSSKTNNSDNNTEEINNEKTDQGLNNEMEEQNPNKTSETEEDIKKLTLKATGRSWLEVKKGSEVIFNGFIQNGEIYEVEASKKISVKIGDASKIQVNFNDKDLGFLGKEKEMIKREF